MNRTQSWIPSISITWGSHFPSPCAPWGWPGPDHWPPCHGPPQCWCAWERWRSQLRWTSSDLTCHSKSSPAPLSLSWLIWTPSPLTCTHCVYYSQDSADPSPCRLAISSSRQVSRLSILFRWPEFSSLSSSIWRPCSCRMLCRRANSSLWAQRSSVIYIFQNNMLILGWVEKISQGFNIIHSLRYLLITFINKCREKIKQVLIETIPILSCLA